MSLTKKDLKLISKIFDEKISNLPTKDEVRKIVNIELEPIRRILNEKVDKNEFYELKDQVAGIQKTLDTELIIVSKQIELNREDIVEMKIKLDIKEK